MGDELGTPTHATQDDYLPVYYATVNLVHYLWMQAGDHRRIMDTMDDYMPHNPEGGFGHYLMMLGAVGGPDCTAPGELFSDYENATGTGQVHVWFEKPAGGWTA